MQSVTEIAETMKGLLTSTAERLARETGFVQRQSKLGGAAFAQATVLGWQQHPDARLSQLAQAAAAAGVPLSPQGLDQRFSESAATFLAALLQSAVSVLISTEPVALPLLARFSAVVVEDSSVLSLPDGLAALWRGCGDAIGQHLAALKIALRLDLLTGTLQTLALADGRVADRSSVLQRTPIPAGVLRLADLGYFAVTRLRQIAEGQAFFLSRLQVQTAVFLPTGERLDLAHWLTQQTTPMIDQVVQIGAREHLEVRLLAMRVPQEVADQRRRRLREEARRRGQTVSAATLALASWTLLITNVPADRLSLNEATVLYRVRWQIELLFKLWKNWGRIDEWRTTKDWRILCEVYAKLIGIVLQHWLLITGCWRFPDRSLVKAVVTLHDHALLLLYALAGHFDLTTVLTMIQRALATCPRMEHRAKHPATFQLLLKLSDAA